MCCCSVSTGLTPSTVRNPAMHEQLDSSVLPAGESALGSGQRLLKISNQEKEEGERRRRRRRMRRGGGRGGEEETRGGSDGSDGRKEDNGPAVHVAIAIVPSSALTSETPVVVQAAGPFRGARRRGALIDVHALPRGRASASNDVIAGQTAGAGDAGESQVGSRGRVRPVDSSHSSCSSPVGWPQVVARDTEAGRGILGAEWARSEGRAARALQRSSWACAWLPSCSP
eukprot:768408-Hanusia_phi.AAC.11